MFKNRNFICPFSIAGWKSNPSSLAWLMSFSTFLSSVKNRHRSPSSSPLCRNWQHSMVLPLPGGPDIRVIVFFGNPPKIISSKPGMPVFILSSFSSVGVYSLSMRYSVVLSSSSSPPYRFHYGNITEMVF